MSIAGLAGGRGGLSPKNGSSFHGGSSPVPFVSPDDSDDKASSVDVSITSFGGVFSESPGCLVTSFARRLVGFRRAGAALGQQSH